MALVLCLWLFGYAAHLHAEAISSSTHGAAHCDFCLARPSSAAPPPAELHAPIPFLVEIAAPATAIAVVTARGAPSSYLSRAPPAL